MDYKLVTPRGEPPIPGKTEMKEETMTIISESQYAELNRLKEEILNG